MKLLDNWQQIIRHAWSIRLIILAALLSGAEVVLSLVTPGWLGVPAGTFAILSGVVSVLALVARLIAQKELEA